MPIMKRAFVPVLILLMILSYSGEVFADQEGASCVARSDPNSPGVSFFVPRGQTVGASLPLTIPDNPDDPGGANDGNSTPGTPPTPVTQSITVTCIPVLISANGDETPIGGPYTESGDVQLTPRACPAVNCTTTTTDGTTTASCSASEPFIVSGGTVSGTGMQSPAGSGGEVVNYAYIGNCPAVAVDTNFNVSIYTRVPGQSCGSESFSISCEASDCVVDGVVTAPEECDPDVPGMADKCSTECQWQPCQVPPEATGAPESSCAGTDCTEVDGYQVLTQQCSEYTRDSSGVCVCSSCTDLPEDDYIAC